MSGLKLWFHRKYYMPGFFYAQADINDIIPHNDIPLCSSTLVFIILYSGSMEICVNSGQPVLAEGPGKIVSISPNSVFTSMKVSPDMKAIVVAYGLDFLIANMNILKYIPDISFQQKFQHCISMYDINAGQLDSISASSARFEQVIADKDHFYWEEMIRITALEIHLQLSNVTLKLERAVNFREVSRSRDIYRQFFLNILNDVRSHREVSYYAGKLCISPKYLNSVIHKVTGQSASAVITEIAIMKAAVLLRDLSLSVKQISSMMNFRNQSAFTRFFIKGMGCTPTEFRFGQ